MTIETLQTIRLILSQVSVQATASDAEKTIAALVKALKEVDADLALAHHPIP